MFKTANPLTISLLLWLAFATAWADDQPLTYDRINLSVSASNEVENDIVVAILYAQREGSDARPLADEVNKNIQQGIERAKQTSGVKVQTLDYQTRPIYQKQRLTGWRVRQSIRLESRDVAQLTKLIGELQEQLALESISYSISEERRQAVQDELIAEALASFKQRAELITKQLGRSGYRLVHMDVNTGGLPRPLPRASRAAPMAMEATVAPPTLEAGTQTVQITISGMIELQVQ